MVPEENEERDDAVPIKEEASEEEEKIKSKAGKNKRMA